MRLLALAFASALLLAAASAGAEPQVRTTVTPRRTHVGEVVKLRLQVDREEGGRVSLPVGASFRPFEVVRRRTETSVQGKRVRETLELQLITFELGDQAIPSVEVRVYDRAGRIHTLHTDPATVHVASLLGNEPDAKRRGSHGPVPVYEESFLPLWIAVGVVLFALQFLVLRWVMKRRAVLQPTPIVIVKRPPWEIALEKLRSIERSRLVEKGLVKEQYDGVSDVIREYLGALGGFEGLESTSEEVLRRLAERKPPGVSIPEVETFFSECDLVKFARYAPAAEGPGELLAWALRIVETARAAAATTAMPPEQAAA